MSACEACGQPVAEEVVVVEEPVDLEPVAVAEVEVARIEADRDVTIAKIESKVADEELIATIAALSAENEALRAAVVPEPEPEPEPVVVVADADAQAEAPAAMEPPPVEDAPAEPKKRRSAWWG